MPQRVVGLRYEADDGLPEVILKGAGPLAEALLRQRMRQGPPLVKNEALLDALYRLPIDSPIGPELFQAVICGAPLLDMVRYDKFKVAKFWVPEYGSADDPKQFQVLYKYSPYHHVEKGVKYPAVMFVTGDADTRVDPLHARKMAALLQASTASEKPILLHYDTKAGHSGGLPIDRLIENNADELAFLVWQLGMQ